MLCSAQAGCRQLSALSLFSSLPSRVNTPKGGADRQDLVCPICHGKINVLLGWLEGHSVCPVMTAFSSSVPSPVLCLPLGLAMQSSWKDLWWQPCIMWVMCSITHLAIDLTLLQKEKKYRAALRLLGPGPAGWPWGASPEKVLSEGTVFCSRRMWGGCFHQYTSLFWRGLSPLCHNWGSSVYTSLFLLLRFYVRFPLVHIASSPASSWSGASLLFPLDCLHLTAQWAAVKAGQDKERKPYQVSGKLLSTVQET